MAAILRRFSLPAEPEPALMLLCKRSDRAAAFFEAVSLAGFTRREAERIFGRPALQDDGGEALAPLPVEVVEQRYLERFFALERNR